jgi:hypothetical protein
VGTGTFQSNSPVGVGSSVHDMHAYHTFDRLTFFRCPRFTNLAGKFTITHSMSVTIIVIIQNINQFITLYTKFEIRWHHVIYT